MSSSYTVSNYGTTDQNDVSNSDVKVKVFSDQPYAGMDKDTLLRFSQAPLWRHLRTAILSVYILGWLGILGTIIGVSVVYPRCPATPQLEWWQKSIVYQIFPRSFQDSNADGKGDLNGIESRLDYIKDLGVGAVWMGSVYKSPMKDFGYDVSDFKDIDPVFGTLDDMKSLTAKMKETGLHLILDFIPNHTSDQHPWFNNSRHATDPSDHYYSYYVWRDCGNDTYRDYPTNWVR
ncbi:neutral and basic amino acid transport protein rBAT [Lingula anatina]|uniref:Neutral and basic amino acid transport protein rBAT n=1 Tax=Lingula anatina TaxID=7574 RepID=A0A1S3I8W9_LINAN|nr:neutral and basic amino acid transport protein rBAT [Lingula anatina]XP_013394633.1 neutral and basic amino acid transport protein rBAT [Lingula anatina]XP_023931155.1 neutral and basic amino acid transport protein rBAT [Lingula anatina]|eukprot:XP_013394632.1 neutral and basic amino acid transport protein rBAT [Lingula anatina]